MKQGMEVVLLPLAVLLVLGGAVLGFKTFWPSNPEPSSTMSSSLLNGGRQLTTGQIARGVFWGMWLFWLSQIIVAGIVMLLLVLFGAVVIGGLGSVGG